MILRLFSRMWGTAFLRTNSQNEDELLPLYPRRVLAHLLSLSSKSDDLLGRMESYAMPRSNSRACCSKRKIAMISLARSDSDHLYAGYQLSKLILDVDSAGEKMLPPVMAGWRALPHIDAERPQLLPSVAVEIYMCMSAGLWRSWPSVPRLTT